MFLILALIICFGHHGQSNFCLQFNEILENLEKFRKLYIRET